MAMSETARAAVVGLGGIAEEHLKKLGRLSGAQVVGICDLSGTLVEAVGDRYGVGPGYTDYETMLREARPDAVHVLTPPETHRDLVLAALAAGAHAFVEKPIAPSLAVYEEMRDAALAAGRMLVENYNYLFMPDVQRALQMIRAGEVGEPVNLDVSMGVGLTGAAYADPAVPHFAHRLPGGAMRNFASHPASIVAEVLGDWTTIAVSQRRLMSGLASNDELRALVEDGSRSATISITSHSRPFEFAFTARCTGATVVCDVLGQRLGVAREGSPLSEVGDQVRQGVGMVAAAAGRVRRATTSRAGYFEGFETLLDGFYAAVAAGGPPPITIETMDATNRLVEALFAPESQL
jgi:predicted dehydrogenase